MENYCVTTPHSKIGQKNYLASEFVMSCETNLEEQKEGPQARQWSDKPEAKERVEFEKANP